MAAKKSRPRKRSTPARVPRTLDARRDTLDFRDKMYVPTLVEVPTRIDLDRYKAQRVPILDQGSEGACTGFGLATVANYLLASRRIISDRSPVSPRMLYAMAKRYDEWPGENYSGSSARGGMKGWHKHGVATEKVWPYVLQGRSDYFTEARAADARQRPLGAYFRVNHKDLVAMHSAIAEVGILYATCSVHEGWDDVAADGSIPYSPSRTGGHAFAIVAFDQRGFWIQNSWGKSWGADGFGQISYDDWLENGTDVWVARLGAPVVLQRLASAATTHAAGSGQSNAYAYPDLRPHIISLGNDGQPRPGGNYGTSASDIMGLFENEIPAAIDTLNCQHVLLYAHGGLTSEATAVQRLADYRPAMLSAGVYPLAFIWHTDYWTTIKNILDDAFGRRLPEGRLDSGKDFMLDRLDDALEPLARVLTGKSVWDEMKENALRASESENGGALLVATLLGQLCQGRPKLKVHVVGHSAGSIFHGPLVTALANAGIRIETCTLWAPACNIELFKKYYMPLIMNGGIKRQAIYALTDKAEQDDNCANIYHKSLLYLVANAFEAKPRIPLFRDGEPILGMEYFLKKDKGIQARIRDRKIDLVLTPNDEPVGSVDASKAQHHGDFDDDGATVKGTLARILNKASFSAATLQFHRSAASLRERRSRAEDSVQQRSDR
jgi:hypothetical protein